MNKNFEEEYKSYVQAEVPDLWKRIEAGIDAQMQQSVPQTANIDEQQSNIIIKQKKKKSKAYYIRVWSAVAAACLCILIITPLAISQAFGLFENKSASTCATAEGKEEAAMDFNMEAAYEEAECEQAACEEGYVEDAPFEFVSGAGNVEESTPSSMTTLNTVGVSQTPIAEKISIIILEKGMDSNGSFLYRVQIKSETQSEEIRMDDEIEARFVDTEELELKENETYSVNIYLNDNSEEGTAEYTLEMTR